MTAGVTPEWKMQGEVARDLPDHRVWPYPALYAGRSYECLFIFSALLDTSTGRSASQHFPRHNTPLRKISPCYDTPGDKPLLWSPLSFTLKFPPLMKRALWKAAADM